jgi:Cu-Zn family superoxide dismutase
MRRPHGHRDHFDPNAARANDGMSLGSTAGRRWRVCAAVAAGALCVLAAVVTAHSDPPTASEPDRGLLSGSNETGIAQATESAAQVDYAVAVLRPTEGSEVGGTVTFTRVETGIQVEATVTGLTPGNHGFHIHEYGDCRAADAASAGGHYNPDLASHGGPQSEPRCVGDLGNIRANEGGAASYSWIDSEIALDGEHSILGRAVVIAAGEDDGVTQPWGGGGPAVACGVIGVAAEPE